MPSFQVSVNGTRIPVDFGGGATITNRGPGTLSYSDRDTGAATATLAVANAALLEGVQYLFASVSTAYVTVDGLPPDYVSRVRLPNVTITYEANPIVNVVQFGDDGPGTLLDQHITSADNTTTGSGAGITLNPGAASGTDQAGAPLTLSSGISTGSSGSGSVGILTSNAGASGVQQNAQTAAAYFWGSNLEKALTPGTDNANDLGYDTLRWRRVKASQYIELTKMVAPAAPAANTARFFSRDNGSGKVQLCALFPSGAVQVISTEP